MLQGLGATVSEVSEPFHPEEGAYSHGHEPAHALLNR
jgi:urease accessory protein